MKRTPLERKTPLRPGGTLKTGVRKREVECPECGERREVYADRDVLVCRDCSAKARRKGKMLTCALCGEEFYATQTNLKRNRQFCSDACRDQVVTDAQRAAFADPERRKKLSEAKLGTKNPNYKNGKRRGQDTHRSQFNLRLKGEERCRNCGARAEHLHHIVPRSKSKAVIADLRNGLPLCVACHFGWHHKTVTIYETVLTNAELGCAIEHAGRVWVEQHYPKTPEQRWQEADGTATMAFRSGFNHALEVVAGRTKAGPMVEDIDAFAYLHRLTGQRYEVVE